MSKFLKTLAFLALAIFASPRIVHADGADDWTQGESHIERAAQAIAAKNFGLAREEAEAATQLVPRNPTAWGLLGAVAQRTGDYATAVDAYQKALALNPKPDSRKELTDRLKDALDERQDKESRDWGAYRSGFRFGYSAAYTPGIYSDINTSVVSSSTQLTYSAFDLVLQIGMKSDFDLFFGYRFFNNSSGKTGKAITTSPATGQVGATSTTLPAGSAVTVSVGEPIFGLEIPLTHAYGKTGHFAFFIPVQIIGIDLDSVQVGSDSFSGGGADFAFGLGVRYCTHSPFVFDVIAQEHIGWVSISPSDNNYSYIPGTGSSGYLNATTGGFELRIGTGILF